MSQDIDMHELVQRFHFYHRFKIRGIQHIVFYSLPQIPEFYSELVNLMSLFEDTVLDATIFVLYILCVIYYFILHVYIYIYSLCIPYA